MEKLTPRQQQILDLIRRYISETGFPPTRMDISNELGFKSANAAEEHLRALERKGVIRIIPGASRGIQLADEQGLPIIGRVAAGNPILAQENVEGHCAVPPDMFFPRADYLLKVRGDSMREVGIMDGDLLAVHKTDHAENGQIVVARVDDEVTVKRLRTKKNKIYLLPENSDYAPIEVDPQYHQFAIEGRAVGVIRNSIF